MKCNQPAEISGRKVGKHNRFPVEGRHAQHPDEVALEKPLLIHPASGLPEDNPTLHLVVDTKNGVIGHLTPRGKKCIEIFALNDRTQLLEDRRRACREAWLLLNKVLTPGGDPGAAQDLADIKAGMRSFTMAQRAVIGEAKSILGPIL